MNEPGVKRPAIGVAPAKRETNLIVLLLQRMFRFSSAVGDLVTYKSGTLSVYRIVRLADPAHFDSSYL